MLEVTRMKSQSLEFLYKTVSNNIPPTSSEFNAAGLFIRKLRERSHITPSLGRRRGRQLMRTNDNEGGRGEEVW